MLNRCLLLVLLSTASTWRVEAAATVTCSQPGFSETVSNGICSVGQSSDTLMFGAYTRSSISGNTFNAVAYATVYDVPRNNPGPYPMTASATWNDIFDVPVSSPTDVLKITVYGGGLDHPATIGVGPILYTTSDFCDAHYTGNPVCTKTATLSGEEFLSVLLTGADTVTIGVPCGGSACGISANADLSEYVSIQQYLANGVTPDPFTTAPEPASLALLLLGVPAAMAFSRRR